MAEWLRRWIANPLLFECKIRILPMSFFLHGLIVFSVENVLHSPPSNEDKSFSLDHCYMMVFFSFFAENHSQ